MIRLHIIVLFVCSLNNPEPCDQDPFISILFFQDFSKFLTGMCSLVASYGFICDSNIIDTQQDQPSYLKLPGNLQELPPELQDI